MIKELFIEELEIVELPIVELSGTVLLRLTLETLKDANIDVFLFPTLSLARILTVYSPSGNESRMRIVPLKTIPSELDNVRLYADELERVICASTELKPESSETLTVRFAISFLFTRLGVTAKAVTFGPEVSLIVKITLCVPFLLPALSLAKNLIVYSPMSNVLVNVEFQMSERLLLYNVRMVF